MNRINVAAWLGSPVGASDHRHVPSRGTESTFCNGLLGFISEGKHLEVLTADSQRCGAQAGRDVLKNQTDYFQAIMASSQLEHETRSAPIGSFPPDTIARKRRGEKGVG